MKKKRILRKKNYVMALGLFELARRRYAEAAMFEQELCRVLNYRNEKGNLDEYMGNISDATHDKRPFDEVLRLEGFVVK